MPLPQSGFRFGDIVLRDGVPNGFRVWQGVEVPVFDTEALWKSSDMGTYEVEIGRSVSVDLLGKLEELAIQRGWGFERTAMIRQLDDRCDKGTVSATSPPAETGPGTAHQCLASAPDEESLRSLFGEFELEGHCSLNARILCRLAPSAGNIEVTADGS